MVIYFVISLRIYPQDQNHGGFFVAVLEKVREFGSIDRFNNRQDKKNENNDVDLDLKHLDAVAGVDAVADADAVAEADADDDADADVDAVLEADADNDNEYRILKKPCLDSDVENEKPKNVDLDNNQKESSENKQKECVGWKGVKESPFIFIPQQHPTLKSCIDTYGLSSNFPKDLFVIRTDPASTEIGNIYVVSHKGKEILTCRNSNSLKLVNTGVKLFSKNGGKNQSICPFRVSSEGVSTILPYLSQARQISIKLPDLVLMIKNEYPKIELFSTTTQQLFKQLSHGSCLLRCDSMDDLYLPFFKAHVSVSLLLDKTERKSLLYRLTGETLEYIVPLTNPLNK